MSRSRSDDRLAAEWPKRCGCCGAVYLPETWLSLVYAYELVDEFGRFECRHCPCGTSLMVLLEVIDLAKE